MRIGDFSRPDHIFFLCVGPAECDIIKDAVVEQDHILGNKTHLAAERFHGIIADVFSIDAYAPRFDIIESRQQVGNG